MSNEYLSTNSLPTLDLNWCVAYICGRPAVEIKLCSVAYFGHVTA